MKIYVANYATAADHVCEMDDPSAKDDTLVDFALPRFSSVHSSLEGALAAARGHAENWYKEMNSEDEGLFERRLRWDEPERIASEHSTRVLWFALLYDDTEQTRYLDPRDPRAERGPVAAATVQEIELED